MNPVLLFIGGIVLGVLLSLSFVNRTSPSTTSYDLTTATDKISDPIVSSNTINNLSVTENVNVSFAKLVDSPVSVERKDTDNSLRTRWAPGKEGGLAKLKSLADQSQSFFVSNEEIVGATSASPGTNIASATGSNGDLEKMRPAQLKRKHRQEQLNKRINGPGGSTSTATTTTVSTATTTTNNLATPMSTTLSHTINTLSPSTFNASLPRLSSTSNPFIPYHSQASTDFSTFKAYIPSLEAVSAQQRSSAGMPPLPDMSKQRGAHETENLKLHHCNGVFEAYSASYLTTRQHMLNVASEGYNLSWVNCEMASFIHMKESNKFYSNPQADGLIMQSLDVLDLSVIHLSAFERSSKKYRHLLWTSKADMNTQWMKIDPVKRAGSRLSDLNNPVSPTYRKIRYSPEAQRTVVIMPFLGGAMGAGHSELGNRFEYLKACFWSFYEFVPNIVAGVTRQEDVDWCM